MSNKIKLFIQKRTSLKSQITHLTNLLDKEGLDNTALKLRMTRLTELYRAFEETNDELAVLDPNDAHEDEFTNVQERFYALAARVENILNPVNSSMASTSSNEVQIRESASVTTNKGRRIKLPEAPLPTFDGKYENWLSFKNAFRNLIDAQSDLTDIDKFHYLRAALKGEAANKLRIFSVDGINYSRAWELLEKAYEVKRILISRHLLLILNLPTLERETTDGLSKLADDTQQHLASLNALGTTVGPEMIVHILENKLPRVTQERWEAFLDRDELPSLEQLYEFLYKTAVCASKRERTKATDTERYKGEIPAKKRRIQPPNQAFISSTGQKCVACTVKRHPLYLCETFKQWPVSKRIETVKNAKLCYNCLRSHRGVQCKFSNCTICKKRHNTLIHDDKYTPVVKPDTSHSEAVKTD
ncbi:PREDICTED: uncharacterized protein LOC105556703 [Vollenhovia emeryi]|uniref:uncharacterized protein LOC105556703 n=1 Tax=Vollenhovia emeryi TaxID=411798 RepID=UPI0005F54F84|nr:PREDICTED: uncharacterized protein LOC105556703 [Vollenhovia emeryi]